MILLNSNFCCVRHCCHLPVTDFITCLVSFLFFTLELYMFYMHEWCFYFVLCYIPLSWSHCCASCHPLQMRQRIPVFWALKFHACQVSVVVIYIHITRIHTWIYIYIHTRIVIYQIVSWAIWRVCCLVCMFAHCLIDVCNVVTCQSVCLLLGFCLSVENETGEIMWALELENNLLRCRMWTFDCACKGSGWRLLWFVLQLSGTRDKLSVRCVKSGLKFGEGAKKKRMGTDTSRGV